MAIQRIPRRILISALLILTVVIPNEVLAQHPLYDSLNQAERAAVDDTLERLELILDPNPDGKRFGQVIIETLDVFPTETGFFGFLNMFHATTRPVIVSDELLWNEGDAFDIALAQETTRNLRARANFAVVAIVPVESSDPQTVDILIVTSDTWSLRLNLQFDLTNDVINEVLIGLTEQNLAGLHKTIAVLGVYEQDTFQIGPTYVDPRVFRSRWTFHDQLLFAINHEDGELEGTRHSIELGLPLYSLDSEWGFRIAEAHEIVINRLFLGPNLRTYDNPDTDQTEEVPFVIDNTEIEFIVEGLYRMGSTFKHDFSFGYGLANQRFDLLSDTDGVTEAAFTRDILPRSEFESFLTTSYRFFRPEFTTLSNYQSLGFAEDFRLGHQIKLTTDAAAQFIGSDYDFLRMALEVGYSEVVADTVFDLAAKVGGRWDITTEDIIDRFIAGKVHLASPVWGPFRFHLGGTSLIRFNRVTSQLDTLGGESGLRGYPSGAFIGESVILGHFEVRTVPLELLSQYFGLVIFFDAGTIYNEGETPTFLSDVGLGLRFVSPQLQTVAYRFDYAFPTSGPLDFFPGTFTLGVEQVF